MQNIQICQWQENINNCFIVPSKSLSFAAVFFCLFVFLSKLRSRDQFERVAIRSVALFVVLCKIVHLRTSRAAKLRTLAMAIGKRKMHVALKTREYLGEKKAFKPSISSGGLYETHLCRFCFDYCSVSPSVFLFQRLSKHTRASFVNPLSSVLSP